jgi:hypothetical protein
MKILPCAILGVLLAASRTAVMAGGAVAITVPGPAGRIVRVNVCEYPPVTDAVTVAVPAALPAMAVSCTCPEMLLTTDRADRETGPLAEKLTNTPGSGPAALLTCTTSGDAKGVLVMAFCALPLTIVKPVGGAVSWACAGTATSKPGSTVAAAKRTCQVHGLSVIQSVTSVLEFQVQ